MKLTIEKAYELAVKKWEYIVKNGGVGAGLLKVVPELMQIQSGCSYCELFYAKGENVLCGGCPLLLNKNYPFEGCSAIGHPWQIWRRDTTKANAQAVLDLIIKTKPI